MQSLTLEQAARRAERTVKTVRRWITELDLPTRRDGRRYVIQLDDLNHFMATNHLTPGRKRIEVAGDVELTSRLLFAAEWNARQEFWRRRAALDLVHALDRAANDRGRLVAWLRGGKAEPSAPNVRLVVEAFERFVGGPDADLRVSADHLQKLRDVHRLRLADVPYREVAKRISITEDYAKQLEREWQRLYGPAPEGWRDHVGVAEVNASKEFQSPTSRTAAQKAAELRKLRMIATAAKKSGRPFRPVDQRATRTSKGGSKKR